MRNVVRGPWSMVRKAALCLFSFAVAAGGGAQTRVLDDFANVAGWKAAPSQGVTLAVAGEAGPGGPAMRLDFNFQGHGGWAAVRKTVDLELPDNYEFTFRIRGEAPAENLEFKLADASGDNVWWSPRRDYQFPTEWTPVRIRKRQVSFAWGPVGGGEPKRIAAIELTITAGSGGKGSVWISDLALTPLPPDRPYAGTPVLTSSSSLPDHAPAQALTGDGGGWHSAPKASGDQWLQVDFGERREFGGLSIEWNPAPHAFEVRTSDDGATWAPVWQARTTHGGRSFVPTPEAVCRFVRVLASATAPDGVGVSKVTFEPPEFGGTPNEFISSVAKASRRGLYPRSFLGEMASWTLVGDPAPTRPAALLGADGAFEPAPRTFSVEPFVLLEGKLVTWADVATGQALADGDLPIPTVTWHHPSFDLEVTASRDASSGGNSSLLRYRITDRTGRGIAPRLALAVRPLQVNPPVQFLNLAGGAAPLMRVEARGRTIAAAGLTVEVLTGDASAGVVSFDEGDVASRLARGELPRGGDLHDPSGWASGALAIAMAAAPTAEVWVRVAPDSGPAPAASEDPRPRLEDRRAAEIAAWADAVRRVGITGGAELEAFASAMRSNLAYILASRDGPALRPGTRNYARSWIRDGAMMAAALLRLGHPEEVREYLRWYAPHQFASGQVPCVVDRRGADPVPENDSHGELLFLAAEYLRYTGDRATVEAVWPHLASAVGYIDQLRQKRRTDAYRTPEKLAFFGLLPESISHEGYSAKPMHSYWDDFWALKGLEDAVWMAGTLGHPDEGARWGSIRHEFERDLLASIARVRAEKGIAYLPGCAELADFDATSSTVALWPGGADAKLPAEAVEATWERYWREAEARFTGRAAWEGYTPYEWRSVGSLVRLGQRDRAVLLARWLMADRMPAAWNQWPEVVHENPTKAAYLGDLPHAWVGSDFIRSFLDMLAFERMSDDALVIGAGVPAEWLAGDGTTIRHLHTPHGELSFTMQSEADAVHVRIEAGLRVPSGGIVLRPPLPRGRHVATVDGARVAVSSAGEVIVRSLPADVVIRPQGAPTTASFGRDDKRRR